MKNYFLVCFFLFSQSLTLFAQKPEANLSGSKLSSILRLQAANGIKTDEALIYFNSAASNNYDNYDSRKMFSSQPGLPELYTTLGTDTIVINGFNNTLTVPSVPLGFRANIATTYTITAIEISNFAANQPILLLDTTLHVVQDLRVNPVYTFYSGITNSMGRFLIIFSNTWTGSSSTVWSNNTNWSKFSAPLSTDNVYIPSYSGNQPHVTSVGTAPAVCNELLIQKGATLTIDAGKALTASGKTSNNGSFIIKADASASGSFIDNGVIAGTGSFTFEKFTTGSGSITPSGRYWYQSSPLSGAKSSVFNALGTDKLWYYNEPSNTYSEIIDNNTPLDLLKGYVVRLGSNTTLNFTGGNFNTGNISNTNITRTGTTGPKRGFSLVGNPYPSQLDWDLAAKTNLETSIWFRTENLGNTMIFDTYNSLSGFGTGNNGIRNVTSLIPSTQAFWVRVNADGNTGQIAFDNTMRSHNSANSLKSAQLLSTILRMVVADGVNTDEAVIYFNPNASNAYDGYDSQKMFALTPGIPQIYTNVGTDTLVINGLQSVLSNPEVPLGFRTMSASTFTLTATEIANFDVNQTIYLEDMLLGNLQNLRTNPVYTFTSGIINTGSRFKIIFDLTTSTADLQTEPSISVYSIPGKVNVSLTNYSNIQGTIAISNLLGQEMISAKILENKTEINHTLPKGIYVVKVQTSLQKLTKKIIVQ